MRLDNHKAYPYPVIRETHDDFLNESFSAEPLFILELDRVNLTIDYLLSSNPVKRDIESGHATYLTVISCRDTFFHQVYQSAQANDNTIYIDTDQLKGEVKVESFVYVTKDTSIDSININKEFLFNNSDNSSVFNYSKGSIIAQENEYSFYVDIDLFKPLGSIFTLEVNDKLPKGEWRIFSASEKVVITVARNLKKIEENLTNNKFGKSILLNSIYFAAVMHLVNEIKLDPGITKNYLWARVVDLRMTLKEINLEIEDAYIIASKLMENPLSRLNEGEE